MNFNDYISDIAEDSQVNFLGFATTPWHAHGIVACLSYLKSLSVNCSGYIFIYPHAQTGYAINETIFYNIGDFIIKKIEKEKFSYLGYLQKMALSLKYILRRKPKKIKRTIFFVEPWTIDSYHCSLVTGNIKGVNICHIVYDEGVSTYFPIKLKSHGLASRLINFYTKAVTYGIGYKYLTRTKDYHNAKLFLNTGRIIVVNDLILPYYIKALKQQSLPIGNIDQLPTQTVLICTTAWERREIEDMADVKVIKTVADELIKKGYNVIFKRHPRDLQFRVLYNEYTELCSSGISLESLLAFSNTMPIAVLSISSTILVTCRLFFNIKCYDLSELLDKDKIGRYVEETTAFQEAFGNYVQHPKNLSELLQHF